MATNSNSIIKKILEEAYGKSLVKDNVFQTEENGEMIYYLENSCNIQKKDNDKNRASNGQFYITSQQEPRLNQILKLQEYTKEFKKAFLFLHFEGFDKHIFSIEVKSFSSGHVQFQTVDNLNSKLGKTKDNIVRFTPNTGRGNEVFVVAINIGSETSRDYSALKNYIISSDNRTYNKVIRNMIEYVEVEKKEIPQNETKLSHNLLVSGAPGTGKSYFLSKKKVLEAGNSIIDEMVNNDHSAVSPEIKKITAQKAYCDKYVTRVTFYEDYSYENFIGCYKPIPKESCAKVKYNGVDGEISEEKITYDYVSGPFIDTYVKAKKDPKHNFFIIIEEINRAKAASVFGEMFQLLDRDKDGISDYEIKPDAALNTYLVKELGDKYDGLMKLPHNMYLWATMNSADQGVMPLDSAFKRRWTSMYMDINANTCGYEICIQKSPTEVGTILWDELRKRINDVILSNGFDEDRCIGPWYFSESEICEINNYYKSDEVNKKENGEDAYYLSSEKERLDKVNPLIDKLFFYLRQDVFRRNPTAIFNDKEDGITMSDLRRRVRQGESVESILALGETKLPWKSIINTMSTTQWANDEETNNNTPEEV